MVDLLHGIGEFVTGNSEENAILKTSKSLKGKRVGGREALLIQQADLIGRRLFIRRLVLGSTGIAGIAILGNCGNQSWGRTDNRSPQQSIEDPNFDYYIAALHEAAKVDSDSKADLDFLVSRRIGGTFVVQGPYTNILTPRNTNPDQDIVTASVDPVVYPEFSATWNGFASSGHIRNGTPAILLRKTAVNRYWAAGVLDHEIEHAKQHFKLGPVQSELGPGMQDPKSELEGYQTQIRVMDSLTGGKFSNLTRSVALGLGNQYGDGISQDVLEELSGIIGPAENPMEAANRRAVLFYASNYDIAKSIANSADELKNLELDFMKRAFLGEFGE
jgi:hypothetical protein